MKMRSSGCKIEDFSQPCIFHTSIGRVAVCADQQGPWKGVVLQNDLMDNAAARFPKSDTVFL